MSLSSDTASFIKDLKNIILEQELRPIATEIVNLYSKKSFSEENLMALFEKHLSDDVNTESISLTSITIPEVELNSIESVAVVDNTDAIQSVVSVSSPSPPVAVVQSPIVSSPVASSPVVSASVVSASVVSASVVSSPVVSAPIVSSPVVSVPVKVNKVRKKRTKKNKISGLNIFKKLNSDLIKTEYKLRKVDNKSLKSATIASELWTKADQLKYTDKADKLNIENDKLYNETLKNQQLKIEQPTI